MTDKLPTIQIRGNSYVLVKDRILRFNELYPNGSIETEIVSPPESKTVVVKATITPDVKNPTRRFVGHSQAVIGQGMINTTSALENCETSAVGRSLAMSGIGVNESVASADEVVKAITQPKQLVDDFTREKEPDWIASSESPRCAIHNVPMLRGISKTKTDIGGSPKKFFYHYAEDKICFGRAKE